LQKAAWFCRFFSFDFFNFCLLAYMLFSGLIPARFDQTPKGPNARTQKRPQRYSALGDVFGQVKKLIAPSADRPNYQYGNRMKISLLRSFNGGRLSAHNSSNIVKTSGPSLGPLAVMYYMILINVLKMPNLKKGRRTDHKPRFSINKI